MNVTKCDNCNKEEIEMLFGFPIRLNCGYGSRFDGQTLDFCSDKCLLEYLKERLK